MANAYFTLDSIDTLSQYRLQLEIWKREGLYELWNKMRAYHDSLEQDQRWAGQSHKEFYEEVLKPIYDKWFQPAAQAMDEGQQSLTKLQQKAEELGIR